MITGPPDLLEVTRPEPGIVVLSVRRPERLNALNKGLLALLDRAIASASADPGLRVLILTGAGEKAFIAGSDLEELSGFAPHEAADWSRAGHGVVRRLASPPLVTIAAVNGYALGSGTELALACDFVLASGRAAFGLPEVGLGLIPGHGGTVTLPLRVGPARAAELILSGRRVAAEEALRIGLASEVVPPEQLMGRALELARSLAAHSRPALAAVKRLLRGGPAVEAAFTAETHAFANRFATPDQREGLAAFLEKRPAAFTEA